MGQTKRLVVAKCVAIVLAVPFLVYAFSGGPPARKSGVPGESSCSECHFGAAGSGSVQVTFPGGMTYTPGVKQTIQVKVSDPQAVFYGFQLTARLASDERNLNAGSLAPAAGESGVQVICSNDAPRPTGGCPASAPLEFIEHTAPRASGTWNIDWTPPATDQGQVRIYVAGNGANGNGTNSGDHIYLANYTLSPAAAQTGPRVSEAATNWPSAGTTQAPGTFMFIKGENLASTQRDWSGAANGSQLPTTLEGVSVTVGGKPAALHFVSPGQLNVLLPTDDITGTVEVRITNAQGTTTTTTNIQRYAPGFYPYGAPNDRYVVAHHPPNFTLVGKPDLIPGVASTPAKPGETIVMWAGGLGPTNPPTPSLQVLSPPFPTIDRSQLRVTIGGRDAQVDFAGAVFAGVFQLNVVVPADLPDGDHAVVATIGGVSSSPNALITVQR